MTNSSPQPGVYAKGDQVRIAETATEAVRYTFEGYVRQEGEQAEQEAVEQADEADTVVTGGDQPVTEDEPHQEPVDGDGVPEPDFT